ncbi:altered inheritance of mitochondria protein 21 [Cladorrhinum sp. PSN332]|nr:altered inheritance of mitochondria protein 21 [Cladorrhinum sp. PSN332]
MSTTAAQTHQPPVVPPRPSRSPGQDKASTAAPMVPPRPAKTRIQRSISPNPDRFAPSPLNESAFAKAQKSLHPGHHADHIPRSTSVDLPSLGQEGAEYATFTQELSSSDDNNTDPEHTRTVGEDVKLHEPKPSLPAASAKQRVMAVTRTDSDRAASFGIGRPSSHDDSTTTALPSGRSLKKKASTTSQLSTKSDLDDEQGIPEIGLQVPMYKNAGDVQAPSPAPGATEGNNHKRRTSARGSLPPGSYGLHGHGVVSQDKLDKAYYDKHPELRKKEHYTHHHDRVKDFSMSSEDLNKIVRDTLANGSGLAVKNYPGTPSDQVAWQALEESASRVASPGPSESAKPASPPSDSGKEARRPSSISDVIHVEEPNRRRSVMFSEVEDPKVEEEEGESPYSAPILADDEVAKDPSPYAHEPAVELSLGESTSRPTSRPNSRPSSRPASIYKEASFELRPTPLEDVEEYEPLFNDDDKPKAEPPVKEEVPSKKNGATKKQRFPSADIWEDAPSSVYYTAEVSTPDVAEEENEERKKSLSDVPQREGETPAQEFARRQEELAEKETRERGPDGFIPGRGPQQKPPSWAQHQLLKSEGAAAPPRPGMANRFPSRDVWEDAPDSLKLETTVSTPQQDEEEKAEKAESPVQTSAKTSPVVPAKPEIPSRPKPRTSGDDKPAIPERPKPAIPTRPVKAGPTSGGQEPAEAAAPPKQKPAVPARPAMGSKIAALQAGFMSDLNRRLQLGPQAVQQKKEEPKAEEGEKQEEKAPLSDARKGRARGPQRRAPTAAKAEQPEPVKAEEEKKEAPTFSFSFVSSWDIDPEKGVLSVGVDSEPAVEEKEEEATPEVKKEVVEEEKKEPTLPGAFPGTDPLTPLQKSEAEVEIKPEAEAEPEEKKEEEEEEAEEVKAEPEEKKSEPEPKKEAEPEKVETKSLVTNTAGETIVAEEVKKRDDDDDKVVEPVKVEEKGGQAA